MSQIMPGTALGFLLNDVSRLFRQSFERAIETSGIVLTTGEIRTLAYIRTYPGSRQVTLADMMGIEAMTVSAYVDRLELRGLVLRIADPTDRRAKVICTTENVEAVLDEVRPIADQIFDQATQSLTLDQVQILKECLVAIREHLNADIRRPAATLDQCRRDDPESLTFAGAATV